MPLKSRPMLRTRRLKRSCKLTDAIGKTSSIITIDPDASTSSMTEDERGGSTLEGARKQEGDVEH
jgi:hypothetical protein